MEEKNKFLSSQTILRILAFLILINTIYLDTLLFKDKKTEIIEKTIQVPVALNACPASCISEINNATRSATLPINNIPMPIPTSTIKSISPAQNFVKEFFIPFGTGSNSSDDWQDIPGLRATLDSGNYKNIKINDFLQHIQRLSVPAIQRGEFLQVEKDCRA